MFELWMHGFLQRQRLGHILYFGSILKKSCVGSLVELKPRVSVQALLRN